jgi:hypothetical protein
LRSTQELNFRISETRRKRYRIIPVELPHSLHFVIPPPVAAAYGYRQSLRGLEKISTTLWFMYFILVIHCEMCVLLFISRVLMYVLQVSEKPSMALTSVSIISYFYASMLLTLGQDNLNLPCACIFFELSMWIVYLKASSKQVMAKQNTQEEVGQLSRYSAGLRAGRSGF